MLQVRCLFKGLKIQYTRFKNELQPNWTNHSLNPASNYTLYQIKMNWEFNATVSNSVKIIKFLHTSPNPIQPLPSARTPLLSSASNESCSQIHLTVPGSRYYLRGVHFAIDLTFAICHYSEVLPRRGPPTEVTTDRCDEVPKSKQWLEVG